MTCSTCGKRCSGWWELLHGHDCEVELGLVPDADNEQPGDDYLADEQDAAYDRWKEERDV